MFVSFTCYFFFCFFESLSPRYDEMPRNEFGVPAHIPPEISTAIRHTCLGLRAPGLFFKGLGLG